MHPPGLHILPNFLSKNTYDILRSHLVHMYNNAIYQKQFIEPLSKNEIRNNGLNVMTSENHYFFPKDNMHFLENSVCKGHDFSYFFGKNNVPNFIKYNVNINELCKSVHLPNPINYNCGVNFYKSCNKIQTGLKWHTDLSLHGDVIILFGFLNSSKLEFRRPLSVNPEYSFEFSQSSCVIISNDARWKYEHRVVEKETNVNNNEISRISLSIGVKN